MAPGAMSRFHGVLFCVVIRLLLNCFFPADPLFLLHRNHLSRRHFFQRFQALRLSPAAPLRIGASYRPLYFHCYLQSEGHFLSQRSAIIGGSMRSDPDDASPLSNRSLSYLSASRCVAVVILV
jgi:hypothetical protein